MGKTQNSGQRLKASSRPAASRTLSLSALRPKTPPIKARQLSPGAGLSPLVAIADNLADLRQRPLASTLPPAILPRVASLGMIYSDFDQIEKRRREIIDDFTRRGPKIANFLPPPFIGSQPLLPASPGHIDYPPFQQMLITRPNGGRPGIDTAMEILSYEHYRLADRPASYSGAGLFWAGPLCL